jgi:hypothetical protein
VNEEWKQLTVQGAGKLMADDVSRLNQRWEDISQQVKGRRDITTPDRPMVFKSTVITTSMTAGDSGRSPVEYLQDLQKLVEDLSPIQTMLLSHLLQGNLYDDVDQQGDLLQVGDAK